jgi:hypothetical protein
VNSQREQHDSDGPTHNDQGKANIARSVSSL